MVIGEALLISDAFLSKKKEIKNIVGIIKNKELKSIFYNKMIINSLVKREDNNKEGHHGEEENHIINRSR